MGEMRRDDAWEQFRVHVDFYRHYLELTLKLNIFYYAATGAIASFCFSRPDPAGSVRYALVFPALMGVLFVVLCIFGTVSTKKHGTS